MASITNPSTGNAYPYPNTFTLDWWVSNTSGNTHTISWSVTITGGAANHCQSYWNALAKVNINDGGWSNLWGPGASDTSCRGNYSASCGQGAVVASGSFNVSGGAKLQFVVGGGFYSSSNYSDKYSDAWYAPETYTQPAQPTVSISSRAAESATFNVSLSSYGNPSGANGRYIEAAILAQSSYGATYRYAIAQNTSSATITVDNSKSGGLVIKSNTKYWYGGYASNTQKNNSIVTGTFYTLPAAPTASSFAQSSDTTATFNIKDNSAGSGQLVQLQYRYKKSTASSYGSWTNAGSTGNKQTETVNLTGLSAGDYDVQVRAKAGSGDYSTIATYENAFSFLTPTITVSNATFTYRNATSCDVTFTYTISALSSGATHTINATATASSSQTYSTTATNKPITGTFSMQGLPLDETFTLSTTVDGGEASTFSFETPGANPKTRLTGAGKTVRGTSLWCSMYTQFGFGAEGYDNTVQLTTQVYNSLNNAWEASGAGTITSVKDSADAHFTYTFTHTNSSPSGKTYPKYTKLKWTFVVTNAHSGNSITKEVITELPPFIAGKVISAGGQRLNIIGTAIKDRNGQLRTPRYKWPITVTK